MTALGKQVVGLFVDRVCQQWIVRDPEGNFWILPSVERPLGRFANRSIQPTKPSLNPCRDTIKTARITLLTNSQVHHDRGTHSS